MKIIVDGYGGDHAPLSVLQGCEMAIREFEDLEIAVTGNPTELESIMNEHGISADRIELISAEGVIEMEDDPRKILKEKKDCSMGRAFRMLADGEGDAFVSAGSTGAIVVGATFIIKRIRGVKRAALAPILPTQTGCYMLMDAGANIDCKPEFLKQFALMGSVYAEQILRVENPRVGLLNIGTEETKGGDLQRETYPVLRESGLNFVGNVEARELASGACDVLVTDGFSGNIVLKLTEGLGLTMVDQFKSMFLKNLKTKLAALALKPQLREFKHKMDYTEQGGAPLLGVAKPVIKAHGSSNAKAFKNAIRQARDFVNRDVIARIGEALADSAENEAEA